MRILLLTSEEWNDFKYGNNNMTNWFSGFKDVELAHVYCSSGKPENQCCYRYFQISDGAMLRSLLLGEKAGRQFVGDFSTRPKVSKTKSKSVPKFLKGELVRGVRDIVWHWGRVNRFELFKFIDEFQPEIVFSQRKASIRILRIEKEVRKYTANIPFIVYTADDEYSLKQFSLNPIYWIRRFAVRACMRKNVKFYDKYYTDAEAQGEEYARLFNIPTQFLAKCGNFDMSKCHQKVHNPIRIVYAGKLYCNRWKTLEKLAKTISIVNTRTDGYKFRLEIYTQSPIKKKYHKWLDNQKDSFIRGKVSPSEVLKIYDESDIALHVESFDLANRLATRYSFSTKIIDCLATGCAVMAICDKKQNGLVYLRKNNAAITVDNTQMLEVILMNISDNPNQIIQYARQGIHCGMQNHQKETVQKKLFSDMESLIAEKKGALI